MISCWCHLVLMLVLLYRFLILSRWFAQKRLTEKRQVRFGSASMSHCHTAVGGDFSSDLQRKVQQLEPQVKGLSSNKADGWMDESGL